MRTPTTLAIEEACEQHGDSAAGRIEAARSAATTQVGSAETRPQQHRKVPLHAIIPPSNASSDFSFTTDHANKSVLVASIPSPQLLAPSCTAWGSTTRPLRLEEREVLVVVEVASIRAVPRVPSMRPNGRSRPTPIGELQLRSQRRRGKLVPRQKSLAPSVLPNRSRPRRLRRNKLPSSRSRLPRHQSERFPSPVVPDNRCELTAPSTP